MTNYLRRIIDPYKNLLFLPAGMNNRGVAPPWRGATSGT
jgi:hypothetical protein